MNRKLEVKRASAMNVAAQWRRQYYEEKADKWPKTARGASEDVYNRLCDLGVSPDLDAAAAIVGNKSWTHPTCNGCDQYVEKAIVVGYEHNLTMCEQCLEAGLAELRRS